jgi:undecaprenyl-diphosphatase
MRLPDPVRQTLRTLRERHDLLLLLAFAVVLGGGWAFAGLADWVADGEARTVDQQILLAFRTVDDLADPIGGVGIEEAMRDLTALGGTFLTTLVSVLGVAFFLLDRRPRAALLLAGIIVSGVGVVFAIKFGIDRPRPDLVPHAMNALSPSFPSGHTAAASVVYLSVGALLARALPLLRLRIFALSVAVLVALGVGVSRVYLGVHWPTDVLAGWTIGGGWALAGWLVERDFQRRGWIERSRTTLTERTAPERYAGAAE